MRDGRSRLSLIFLARSLSIAGHPFLLVPLTVAVATRNWLWTSVIAAVMVVPLAAVIVRNVRRGAWSDFDVSHRDQRTGLYRVGLPLLALLAVVLYVLEAPLPMIRGVISAAILFAIGMAANRFLKISLHMMLGAFCAMIILEVHPRSVIAVIICLAALAWSRWMLDRHTIVEIIVGAALGVAAGFYATM